MPPILNADAADARAGLTAVTAGRAGTAGGIELAPPRRWLLLAWEFGSFRLHPRAHRRRSPNSEATLCLRESVGVSSELAPRRSTLGCRPALRRRA